MERETDVAFIFLLFSFRLCRMFCFPNSTCLTCHLVSPFPPSPSPPLPSEAYLKGSLYHIGREHLQARSAIGMQEFIHCQFLRNHYKWIPNTWIKVCNIKPNERTSKEMYQGLNLTLLALATELKIKIINYLVTGSLFSITNCVPCVFQGLNFKFYHLKTQTLKKSS